MISNFNEEWLKFCLNACCMNLKLCKNNGVNLAKFWIPKMAKKLILTRNFKWFSRSLIINSFNFFQKISNYRNLLGVVNKNLQISIISEYRKWLKKSLSTKNFVWFSKALIINRNTNSDFWIFHKFTLPQHIRTVHNVSLTTKD